MNINYQKYAELAVKIGANVKEGQTVRLNAEIDQLPLVEAVTEECYKAGAKRVWVLWDCSDISKLHYKYADEETLGAVLPWEHARAKQMADDRQIRIFIDSTAPDEFKDIPAEKLAAVTRMRSSELRKYVDEIDGKHQWLIVAAPSVSWAKKVFPNETDEKAVELLWDAIMKCIYLDKENPVEFWKSHVKEIREKVKWLNEQQFTKLEYKSGNGTDFCCELIPGAKWCGAGDVNYEKNLEFIPNMPTEEIFISPMRGRCSGKLVATKPLSYMGQLIEDFYVEFKDGKVSSFDAKNGKETLEKMFSLDEGAAMLGELALVPKESPVNTSGILFYNTLFDENACCHVAVGRGFPEVLDGFLDMTKEEQTEKGINDSIIHVDFMIGSDDLSITGYKADGSSVPVFVNGTWL